MDYHKLKRRELQALCKKHGIPANLKNVEMADCLSSLLKEEKPTKRGRSCMKNIVVLRDNDEETVESKEPKRVKFSPQNETFVFEKTDPREARLLARKRRVLRKPEIKEKAVVVGDSVVEEPVLRVLRRRSIVLKPDAVSGAGSVDVRRESLRNLRTRVKDTSVDDMVLSPCVEKKEKTGRKGQAVEEVVEEKCHEIEQEMKKGRRGRKRTKAIKEKEVKRGEEVGVKDLMDDTSSDSRQVVLSKVDASSSEQVVDDGKVHELTALYVNQLVAKVRSDYVQDKETLPSVSTPTQSLSESSEQKLDGETALSGSMAEERHKVMPRRDSTCFSKDNNMVKTCKQPEEAYCLADSTNDDAQRKELESDRENQTSEEDFLGSGGEVEKSISFHIRNSANLTSERTTLHHDVPSISNEIECIAFVLNPCHPVKDLEHMTVENAEDTDDGELEFPVGDNETITDLKSNYCNSPLEIMENETPKVCHSQDSSPFSSQEATNIRLEIDCCTAQTSRSVNSVEMNVEDVSICGNESPICTICNEPDEALGQAFSQQTKFSGSVLKGFKIFDEEAGSVEGATGQDANSGEKKSFISKSESEFGEAVERGLAVQSSILVAVSEEGKSDDVDEIVKDCSIVGINPVYSCSGYIEMDDNSGSSPLTYSGKGDAALGLDNNTGSIVGEPEFSVRDDETTPDLRSNYCNIPVELVENGTPQVSHSRDSCSFTAPETTNIRLEIVDCAAQRSRSADSVELVVGGVSICGNESPKSIICNELDEALGQAFSLQTKSSGPVQKESECLYEEAGSVEGATGQGTNSGEKSNFKSESEFGEAIERRSAVLSSMLVSVSKEGKSDVGDEVVKGCSMVGINPVNSIGNGKDSDCSSGHLEMDEINSSRKRSSGKKLLGDAVLELDYDAGNIVVAGPPVNIKSSCYFTDVCAGTCEIASDSLHISQENQCDEILQNVINGIEELKSAKYMVVKDDQYDKEPDDKVEPDAENSDALPSVTPTKLLSQALVSTMPDGPESIAEEVLVENAITGEKDLLYLIEGVDRNNEAADIAEPRENVDLVLVESLSFSKNGTGIGDIEEAIECTPEEQIDCQMNAGNNIGQEDVIEEKTDCFLDSVQKDASMNENDNLASNGSEDSDSFPCDMGIVSDCDINIVHETLINCEVELEFNASKGNCMSGQRIITQSYEDGYMDHIQKNACMTEKHHRVKEESAKLGSSPCGIYTTNFFPEYIVHKESRSPAYNDNTRELDPAKDPGARDAEEKRGTSLENDAYIIPFTSPLTDATSSEFQIAMRKVLDGTCSQNFIDASGLHEMALEIPSDHLSYHLEMDDGFRKGNSEQNVEDDTTYVGWASNPHSSILENKGVNASEEIVVGCAVQDFIALYNSMEDHGKVAAEHISRDSKNGVEWDGNDNDASDNKADADSSSLEVSENFTAQPQEQNLTPLISSHQQMDMDPTESACQLGLNTTTVLETENDESKIESSLFTDSEVDLFWREIEKEEVRELPTVPSDVKISVDEYEIANVENDTGSTHQPTVGDNTGLEEQTLQEGKGINVEGRGESTEENGDEQCREACSIENSLVKRKNTRSILIHGTPQKPPYFIFNMKENAAVPKRLQMVGATAVKRRKALEDISK